MIWFRHYVGLCRDPKLVAVATRSGQTVERAAWVFCAILESASDRNGPEYEFEPAEAAYFLRCEAADIEAILEAMDGKLIKGGKVINWDRRQYKSDTSTPRVQAHRNRKRKRVKRSRSVSVTPCNVSETAPDTDTESDTEAEPGKDHLENTSSNAAESSTRKRENPAARHGEEISISEAQDVLGSLAKSDKGEDRPRSEPHPIGGMLGGKPRDNGKPASGESVANWILAAWRHSMNAKCRGPSIMDAEQIAEVLIREGPREVNKAAARMVELLAEEAAEKGLKDPLSYLFGILNKGGLGRWLAKETKSERKAREAAELKAAVAEGQRMADEGRR